MRIRSRMLVGIAMAGALGPAASAHASSFKPVHVVWTQPAAAPRVHRIVLNGRALKRFDDARTVHGRMLKVDVFCPTQRSGPTKITITARPGEWLYMKPAASGCGLTFDRIAGPNPTDRSFQRT